MQCDFVVAVWGDWHIGLLDRVMLPTLAAPGNLPAVLAKHPARLRILTRRMDERTINGLPSIQALRALLPVEVEAASEEKSLSPNMHLAWWAKAGEEARERGAVLFNLPPDVAFAEGSVAFYCRQMAQGKKAALAPPQIRVVSESLDADFQQRLAGRPWAPVAIGPREMVRLGIRHMHPLTAMSTQGATHGVPNISTYWPVPGQGLLYCLVTEEVMAFRPDICGVRGLFRLDGSVSMDEVCWPTDSDDGFFLSLCPLAKDTGLLLENMPLDERFLAHWSAHPANNTPLGRTLAGRLARIHHAEPDPALWAEAEAKARQWVVRFQAQRDILDALIAVKDAGCRWGSRFMGLAARLLDLSALVPAGTQATLFVPTDAAIAQPLAEDLARLALPGGEAALFSALKAHAAPGLHPAPNPGQEASFPGLDGRPMTLRTDAAGRCVVNDRAPIAGSLSAGPYLIHLVNELLHDTREAAA